MSFSDKLATSVPTAAMPSQMRTMVQRWFRDNVVQDKDPIAIAKLHASAAVEGVRDNGVAGIMGMSLGAFHALNATGLDVKVPGTTHKVPADALAAGIGFLGSIGAATAPHGMGKVVGTMGTTAMGIYSFRMTNDLIAKMRQKKKGVSQASDRIISKAEFGGEGGWADGSKAATMHGAPDFGAEDPIIKMARGL